MHPPVGQIRLERIVVYVCLQIVALCRHATICDRQSAPYIRFQGTALTEENVGEIDRKPPDESTGRDDIYKPVEYLEAILD